MTTATRILKLNKSGVPRAWVSREQAATLYVKKQVLWTLGDEVQTMLGGLNRQGERSHLALAPIIACDGDIAQQRFAPALTNRLLFRRDGFRCMYCGIDAKHALLTRDHIVPKVQGGADHWNNVVTACARCNHHKGGRTPEQAGMELLAVPFVPNIFEWMYLASRRIRSDQMDYLSARFSGQRTWQAA